MKRSLPFVIAGPQRWRVATAGVVLVLLLVLGRPAGGSVLEVEPKRGRTVAAIDWIDENDQPRNLSQFSGYPLIILPIYTRCRGACVQNVSQLKKALIDSSADPRQYRVLLFSFDASDRPAALVKYRDRESVPLAWSIGAASQSNIDALLDSIGFQVGKAGPEFTHPNMVLFLDPNLRVARWIYGTDYSARDIDTSLRVASGESDWLTRHSEWLYALLLFSGSLLCVTLCYYLVQLRTRRRELADAKVALLVT
ncbi:MAG: SCO family protein [Chthoniobacterales bacterium]